MSNSAWLLILAGVYWVLENQFFGWNFKPQSSAEVIADGIVVLICALSILARPT